MTEHAPQQLDPLTAALQLQAAVDQLTQPGAVELQRDIPLPGTDAWQLLADDNAYERELTEQVHTATTRAEWDAAVLGLQQLNRRRNARTSTAAVTPPLLEQLHTAIESSSSTGGGPAKAAAHRSPIGLDAAQLLGRIQSTTGAAGTDPGALAAAVRAWALVVTPDEPGALIEAAIEAQDWSSAGQDLLNPHRRLDLVNPCPACGKRTASVEKDGETVERPALELDLTAKAVRCLVCREVWREHQFELLCQVLDQQLDEARR